MPDRCYLCGKLSKTLRKICVHYKDTMLIAYLCPECRIEPIEEAVDEKLRSEKQRDLAD